MGERIKVTINVVCARCGEELTVWREEAGGPIMVSPCEMCLTDARQEGRNEV